MVDDEDTINIPNENESIELEEEKMLPQSQVDKIVGKEKYQAARQAENRVRQELESKYQNHIEEITRKLNKNSSDENEDTDINSIINARVEEKVKEALDHKERIMNATHIADTFELKLKQASSNYDDFDEVMRDFNPAKFHHLAMLVANLDNAGDIIYDLVKNPIKLAGLDVLAEKSDRQAYNELLKLSNSISDNKKAKSIATSQQVSPPLDHLKPSNITGITGTSGKLSIADWRKHPLLRG